MKTQPTGNNENKAKKLAAKLLKNPLLFERVEAILDIASGDGETIQRADEIESRLIEEVRKLGNATMRQWAVQTEELSAQQYLKKSPGSCPVKKKT